VTAPRPKDKATVEFAWTGDTDFSAEPGETLESGGPKNSGSLDVIVGPAATANYGLEIDRATGAPGTGALVDTVAFESPPPTGVGMRCSIVDQFSYGHVKVTSKRLTITPKGIDGKPQRNGDKPCGPFVLRFEH
jgi:hypothetical protein